MVLPGLCQLVCPDSAWRERCHSDRYLRCISSPPVESIVSRVAVRFGGQGVAVRTEQTGNLVMSGQEALRLPQRFEAPPYLFSPSRVSVRCFAPIIQTFVLAMLQAGCNLNFTGSIKAKLVRHHNTLRTPTFQKREQKPACDGLVSPRLYENVEHVTFPTDRTPDPKCLAFNLDDNLLEMLFVGQCWPITQDLVGEPVA